MVRRITNESKRRSLRNRPTAKMESARRRSRHSSLREANADMEFVKINASEARKLYDDGETVYLLPNKVRLDNMWIKPCEVNKESNRQTFDKVVAQYIYYNCQNKELGNNINYYKLELGE